MDTFPLYNFFSLLGVKYVAGITVLVIVFSVAAEILVANGPVSPRMAILNAFALGAMSLLAAFIIYTIYKIFVGGGFHYLPLTTSLSILVFLFSLAIIARTVLSDGSGFHILQVLLALIVSLAVAAIFSAFVIVAQRFISG